MLLHQMLHWPDEANANLWPFAMHHAVHLWNHTPRQGSKKAPIEVFSGTVIDHHEHMHRLHVWGAPVYVLDPKLQDGKKLPKWNPRSRLGVYLGFSPDHSTLVSNVLNPRSGHISPQYHVVVDDLFTTVPNANCGGLYDPIAFDATRWASLVKSGLEMHFDLDDLAMQNQLSANSGDRQSIPTLNDHWLTGPERRVRRSRQATREARLRLRRSAASRHNNEVTRHVAFRIPEGGDGGTESTQPSSQPVSQPVSNSADSEIVDSDSELEFSPLDNDELSVVEGVDDIDDDSSDVEGADVESFDVEGVDVEEDKVEGDKRTSETRPKRSKRPNSKFIGGVWGVMAMNEGGSSIPLKRTSTKSPKFHGQDWSNVVQAMQQKKAVSYEMLNEQYLAAIEWAHVATKEGSEGAFDQLWNQTCAPYYDHETGLQDDLHPAFLSTRANAEDNPTWHEAMNGPLREGYIKATEVEIEALEEKDAWDVVDRESGMNVLPSTWAFKCKRYPDGRVRKLKARLCARGDRQIQGVDFHETWAQVVNWNTVRLMLVLSQVQGLATRQVDYTMAFLHAPIDSKVYVEMPKGFQQQGKVLKLKKSLYGLKQSPKNFFSYLSENLEAVGFKAQTDVNRVCSFWTSAFVSCTSTTLCSSLQSKNTLMKQFISFAKFKRWILRKKNLLLAF